LIELIGYREWTEKLGYDREWLIQTVQSKLYAKLQEVAARHGAFIAPLSYDTMLVIANGVPLDAIRELYEVASRESPVPVALRLAYDHEALKPLGRPGLRIEVGSTNYPVAALHIDLNGFTRLRREVGAVDTYLSILEYLVLTGRRLPRAVPAYLGGDNMVFFLGAENLSSSMYVVAEAATRGFKVGIGVSVSPRKALEAAAHALHKLRRLRLEGVEVVEMS
jgi:GTP cyclohydrolase IIa